MNNSQSIERFRKCFSVIDGCELSADQRKAALLVDGLIPPKTTFFSNNREIIPEIAGYGVPTVPHCAASASDRRHCVPGGTCRLSPKEREQSLAGEISGRRERCLASPRQEIAPAKEAAAKDHVRSGWNGACRFGPRALVRPAAGSQVRAGPNAKKPRPQERIARCAGQSASTAPLRIPEPSSGEREKRAENRRRFPPSLHLQNSSSIPPRTV